MSLLVERKLPISSLKPPWHRSIFPPSGCLIPSWRPRVGGRSVSLALGALKLQGNPGLMSVSCLRFLSELLAGCHVWCLLIMSLHHGGDSPLALWNHKPQTNLSISLFPWLWCLFAAIEKFGSISFSDLYSRGLLTTLMCLYLRASHLLS